MAFEDDLKSEIAKKFADRWTTTDGRVVPDETSVGLGNVGIRIEATVFYADMADSTDLVDRHLDEFAAEIYGTFLRCTSRIIKHQGGTITAFDGDRVMAVYMGETKEQQAVWTAMKLNRAMQHILRPALKAAYPTSTYVPNHTVGIDSSTILVIKDGVRGDNDLIWVGRAANHAAKLCALPHTYQTRITQAVRDKLSPNQVTTISGSAVWEQITWKDMGDQQIYRSSCEATTF